MYLTAKQPRSPCSCAPLRILVIEDHPLLRKGMVDLINRVPGLQCCGEADAISGTASLAAQLAPDLVLLDLRLRDGDAFGLLACLVHQSPTPPPILVVSQSHRPEDVDRVMQAGARGFLLKEDAPHKLVEAIHSILDGQFYLSPALTLRLVRKSCS